MMYLIGKKIGKGKKKEVQVYHVCSEKIIFVTSNYLDKTNN